MTDAIVPNIPDLHIPAESTVDITTGYPSYPYSFTGSDFQVVFVSHNAGGLSMAFKSLQTISFSHHSTLIPARRLGERAAHGYARGTRTVAGTLVFLMLGDDPFIQELSISPEVVKMNGAYETRRCHIELIPEFDLIIRAVAEVPINKYSAGSTFNDSQMFIGGITLAESGGTISMHDIYTEVMYTFVAKYMVPFTSSVPIDRMYQLIQIQSAGALSIGQLLEQYKDTLRSSSQREGLLEVSNGTTSK